jgi:hypothetical protein
MTAALALSGAAGLRGEDKQKKERIPIAQNPSERAIRGRLPPQPADLDPASLKLWFPLGETLEYKVYWGVIPVAISRVSATWEELHGRKWIVIRFRTVSNKVLSKLYPVDDTIESWVDPQTFLPFKFNKRLSEGSYRCDETTVFDHAEGLAYFRSNTSEQRWAFRINPDTRDIPTLMYSLRKNDLQPGQTLNFEVMADERLYDLVVRTTKVENVDLEHYGKVSSVKCAPEAAFNGIFVRKGKMTLWVSRDPRRVCTQMVADTPFANVKLRLLKVEGPGDDAWIRKGQSSR